MAGALHRLGWPPYKIVNLCHGCCCIRRPCYVQTVIMSQTVQTFRWGQVRTFLWWQWSVAAAAVYSRCSFCCVDATYSGVLSSFFSHQTLRPRLHRNRPRACDVNPSNTLRLPREFCFGHRAVLTKPMRVLCLVISRKTPSANPGTPTSLRAHAGRGG